MNDADNDDLIIGCAVDNDVLLGGVTHEAWAKIFSALAYTGKSNQSVEDVEDQSRVGTHLLLAPNLGAVLQQTLEIGIGFGGEAQPTA